MLRARRTVVGREVERLLRDGVDPPGGDARLLHRYLAERDEAAFEAIVDRHGPLVLALCRRYLFNPADVEDAFQATFLILTRKGRRLRDGDALSSWLYGVAFRVAVRARADVLKRRAREGDRRDVEEAPAAPVRTPDDSLETLDQELGRLPEKFRAPLVLCYLRGRTHDQAAAELGWPVGTVRSRMARARVILQQRLSRRGVDASACLVLARADLAAVPLVPSSLVAATVAAAGRFAGLAAGLGGLFASSPASARWPAAALAQGVLMSTSPPLWKLFGFAVAAVGLTAGALAVVPGALEAPAPRAEQPPDAKAAPRSVEARLDAMEKKLDRLLDQFPETVPPRPPSPPSPPARAAAADAVEAPDAPVPPDPPARAAAAEAVEASDAPVPPDPPDPPAQAARGLREIEAQLRIAHRRMTRAETLKKNGVASPERGLEEILEQVQVLEGRLQDMKDEAEREAEGSEAKFEIANDTLTTIVRQWRRIAGEAPSDPVTKLPPTLPPRENLLLHPGLKEVYDAQITAERNYKAAVRDRDRDQRRQEAIQKLLVWTHEQFPIFSTPTS
ncbi:RNA polymerase sigma factor [Paludisphaera mucosa]|uniref:RNA polymerase sigma factor n=1 Tax=Paludisphaera mucosa TaxID=3030827 RepID=A0ABT6FBC5_9BACT|nr:RNA polymerase sigma factor [Paludisphaera mucosa]MDG3004898.1 RNA polymerase sigma factor [Paludisphaera mucosa]